MSVSDFKPAWWLRNSHLQTLWPAIIRRRNKIVLERERFELPDGDFIDLDWMNKNAEGPLVIILPGLEGSIDSHYAKSMLYNFSMQGWRGVFMHYRGLSGEPNRLSKGYHSGDTNDLGYLVRILLKRQPNTQLAAIGFSLGGNVLLKWLGETGWQNPLKAAIAVSVPFELHKAAKRIQQGFSRFYQWYFIRILRTRLSKKFRDINTPLEQSIFFNICKISTMIDFDDKVTAPLHGFSGVDEYYTTASSRQYLSRIHVPTLLLQSKDDPFMTEDVIPHEKELSSEVKLEVTETGGHVGFVSGNYPWSPKYWLDERAPAFFKEYLDSAGHNNADHNTNHK